MEKLGPRPFLVLRTRRSRYFHLSPVVSLFASEQTISRAHRAREVTAHLAEALREQNAAAVAVVSVIGARALLR